MGMHNVVKKYGVCENNIKNLRKVAKVYEMGLIERYDIAKDGIHIYWSYNFTKVLEAIDGIV